VNVLIELARVLRLMDPMPPRVLADADAAGLLLRSPARATEELIVLRETVPAVRSAGRRLRFGRRVGEPLVEAEIRPAGAAQRLAGVVPPGAVLTVRTPGGDLDVPVDEAGYFNVEVPAGPLRLRLAEGGRVSETGSF
jgi:hypothetical protein